MMSRVVAKIVHFEPENRLSYDVYGLQNITINPMKNTDLYFFGTGTQNGIIIYIDVLL